MEDKMSKLNDNELEQVTGGKSYAEWEAYINSIGSKRTDNIEKLVDIALIEIGNDPDLSASDRRRLEMIANVTRKIIPLKD